MPQPRQLFRLTLLSGALWIVATLYIRLFPHAFTDGALGTVGFLAAVPVGWLSVRLVRWVGGLGPDQLIAGVAWVGAVAMMIDGAALRWFASAYGDQALAVRLGAAWLLWGYGVALAVALATSARPATARARV